MEMQVVIPLHLKQISHLCLAQPRWHAPVLYLPSTRDARHNRGQLRLGVCFTHGGPELHQRMLP